jgi:hypothetical protein
MTSQEHGHDFITDLPRAASSAFLLSGEEHAEQIIASFAGCLPLRYDAPDRSIQSR